jgi:hypothetical protein
MISLTSEIDAPDFSHKAVIEFIELTLYANIALLSSFPNSLDASLVLMILEF